MLTCKQAFALRNRAGLPDEIVDYTAYGGLSRVEVE